MPPTNPATLQNPPTLSRSTPTRGLSTGDIPGDAPRIDRTGGDYSAGLIRDFAVITRGEALGHYMWIDGEFVDSVGDALAATDGVRVRFTHPDMSSDGLGRKLGRAKFTRRDGDTLRADLHFYQSAHTTPDGDLASHVMDLATEDPELFGASIVFRHDWDAEELFDLQHRRDGAFQSPDPANERNLPHARLRSLAAVDIVDEPAANAGGMFTASTGTIPAAADSLAEYVLGLSADRPEAGPLEGIDPDRLRGFASRFLAARGLTLNPTGGPQMPGQRLNADPETTPATDPAPTEPTPSPATPEPTPPEAQPTGGDGDINSTDPPADPPPADNPSDPPEDPPTDPADPTADEPETPTADPTAAAAAETPEQLSARFGRYVSTFGVENGPRWFSEGIAWPEAVERQNALLAAQNATLQSQLAAAVAATGETDPLSTGGDAAPPAKPLRLTGLSDNAERFAAAIKLPN